MFSTQSAGASTGTSVFVPRVATLPSRQSTIYNANTTQQQQQQQQGSNSADAAFSRSPYKRTQMLMNSQKKELGPVRDSKD